MALQREVSPIPPGRYWIIVESQNIRDFDTWLRDMQGGARVEVAELDARAGQKASQFIIFGVPAGRMPFLNPLQFGFPSFAPPEVKTRGDVVQNELNKNPEDVAVDVIREAGDAAGRFAGLGVLLLLLLGAAVLGGGAKRVLH